MEKLAAYIPMDRRQALAHGEMLPKQAVGSVLFADISGFTPLTAALLKELGLRGGPEELTRQLNLVYEALVAAVHRYGGSVIGFSGDAITCWLDGDDGLRATACGLAMQQAMTQFTTIKTPAGTIISLGMKAAVAAGPVRRFVVGDPNIQYIDVLAGSTLDRMAMAERLAAQGEVIVAPEVVSQLGAALNIDDLREDTETNQSFALVTNLTQNVTEIPWPSLFLDEKGANEKTGKLTESQIRAWLLPPVYDRIKSGQERFLAEIRPAVALFMRFGGIDYDQDELAGEKLDAYIRWIQGIIAHYEGALIQLTLGDKGCYLYAAFGAPLTNDDNAARAVSTALALQSPPESLNFITPAQIGISQGRMRTGAYGGSARSTYGVLGDEVNMAARLMSNVEPGQIMVSERVAQAVTEHYCLKYIGPIKVKGKVEPLLVSLVLGQRVTSVQKPITLFPDPLVGRDDELAHMEQCLDRAANGEGQILQLEGDAGIGKSHLTAEFAERALHHSWRVITGFCQSTVQDVSYYPWRQIFQVLFILIEERSADGDTDVVTTRHIEQVREILETINPDWLVRLPLLGDLLDLPIPDNATTAAFDPRLRQEALFTLVVDLIQTWAQDQPILLMLEDVHWIDEPSQGLTLALARVISQAPVVLVIVHRPPLDERQPVLPELTQLSHTHRLDLGDLSPDGVAALVAHRLHGSPAPLLLELIQVRAKGNPFFVEELIEALRKADHLAQQDELWTLSEPMLAELRRTNNLIRDQHGQLVFDPSSSLSLAGLGLPDSIHELVLSRLDRLPETEKLTLKVASVIGRIFEFRSLAQAHPIQINTDALLEQIEAAIGQHFIRLEKPTPDLTHIFKHNITRDVVYDTLLETQQRQLHQAVAESIESQSPEAVEQLAYHYSRANVQGKTLFYVDKAARKAQRDYANETALNYYHQALDLAERWAWRKGQIEVLHILGRRDEEKVALKTLAANNEVPPFETAYLFGQYYEAIGDYPQAQVAVEQALEASRIQKDTLNEMQCLTQFGAIAYKQGEYEQAKDWYNQALDLFQGQDTYFDEKAQAMVTALNGLGVVHRVQSRFDEARINHKQALTLSRQSGNRQGEAQAFNDLGAVTFYQRHFAEALTYYQQALEIRRTIGDRAGEGASAHNLASVTHDTGDYGQAQEYLASALSILQATGNRWEEVNVWNDLGIMYQELGDYPQAQKHLQQGLQVCRAIGDEIGEAYIMANIGLTAYDSGDLVTAKTVLNEGITIATKHNDNHIMSYLLSYLSAVNLQTNQLNKAIKGANAALKLHYETNSLLFTADNLAILAATYLALGEISSAVNYVQQSLTILDECGGEGPEFPQRDYFICYQVLMADGQIEKAKTALQSAYNLVMTRAKKIIDPILRQSFLERAAFNQEIVAEYERTYAS